MFHPVFLRTVTLSLASLVGTAGFVAGQDQTTDKQAEANEEERASEEAAQASEEDAERALADAEKRLDDAEAKFRELVCARAADDSHRGQDSAVEIAIRHRFVDARFDDVIRAAMKDASKPEHWDSAQLNRAIRLVNVCTLTSDEVTELALHCYLLCDSRERSLKSSLKQLLSRHPNETSRLLLKKMSNKEYSPLLISLTEIVGNSSSEVLPLLLEAAEATDPEVAELAMREVPDLIESLRAAAQAKRQQAQFRKLGRADIDEKLMKYAERVVARYDKNGDSLLTANEYEKMLMSPAPADSDNNGVITITEYASWMQQRSKR